MPNDLFKDREEFDRALAMWEGIGERERVFPHLLKYELENPLFHWWSHPPKS